MFPILTPHIEIGRTKQIAKVVPCDANVEVNDTVYFFGGEAKKASNSAADTMPVVGMVDAKITSVSCRVIAQGWMNCSGVVAGKTYYAGSALGSFTDEVPVAPAIKQSIFVAQTNSIILVNIK
ncbi:MAG: hypothetical protein KJ648_06870 [Candidatus Omnitrophica bacterium]|nr:hypothetical protein [Candidatus Omnitrophota bacterium]